MVGVTYAEIVRGKKQEAGIWDKLSRTSSDVCFYAENFKDTPAAVW